MKATRMPQFLQIWLCFIKKLVSRYSFTEIPSASVGGTFVICWHPTALSPSCGQSPNTMVDIAAKEYFCGVM
ncbi:hypothetical protein PHYBOEH_005025, partial [Phytophthora boehmeriae]